MRTYRGVWSNSSTVDDRFRQPWQRHALSSFCSVITVQDGYGRYQRLDIPINEADAVEAGEHALWTSAAGAHSHALAAALLADVAGVQPIELAERFAAEVLHSAPSAEFVVTEGQIEAWLRDRTV